MVDQGNEYDNLEAIQQLLLAAFTAEDLCRFRRDRATFRPIVHRFGPKYNLNDRPVKTATTPNQGITLSAGNGLSIGLIGLLVGELAGSLVCGLLGAMDGDLSRGLASGLVFGLVFALGLGLDLGLKFRGYAVVRHMAPRVILTRNGHIPWRYACFLDYATNRMFLRTVGGGWFFVHRLLR